MPISLSLSSQFSAWSCMWNLSRHWLLLVRARWSPGKMNCKNLYRSKSCFDLSMIQTSLIEYSLSERTTLLHKRLTILTWLRSYTCMTAGEQKLVVSLPVSWHPSPIRQSSFGKVRKQKVNFDNHMNKKSAVIIFSQPLESSCDLVFVYFCRGNGTPPPPV